MERKTVKLSPYRIKSYKSILLLLSLFILSSAFTLAVISYYFIQGQMVEVRYAAPIILLFWTVLALFYLMHILKSNESLYIEFSEKYFRYCTELKKKDKTITFAEIERIEFFDQDIWVHLKSEEIIEFNLSKYTYHNALEIKELFHIIASKL